MSCKHRCSSAARNRRDECPSRDQQKPRRSVDTNERKAKHEGGVRSTRRGAQQTEAEGGRPRAAPKRQAMAQDGKRGRRDESARRCRRPISAGFDCLATARSRQSARPSRHGSAGPAQPKRQRLRSQAISPAWTFRVTRRSATLMASSRPRLSVVSHTEPLTTYDDAASSQRGQRGARVRARAATRHGRQPRRAGRRSPGSRREPHAHEPEERRTDAIAT